MWWTFWEQKQETRSRFRYKNIGFMYTIYLLLTAALPNSLLLTFDEPCTPTQYQYLYWLNWTFSSFFVCTIVVRLTGQPLGCACLNLSQQAAVHYCSCRHFSYRCDSCSSVPECRCRCPWKSRTCHQRCCSAGPLRLCSPQNLGIIQYTMLPLGRVLKHTMGTIELIHGSAMMF